MCFHWTDAPSHTSTTVLEAPPTTSVLMAGVEGHLLSSDRMFCILHVIGPLIIPAVLAQLYSDTVLLMRYMNTGIH